MNKSTKQRPFWLRLMIFVVCYALVAAVYAWVITDDWTKTAVVTEAVTPSALVSAGTEVEQTFVSSMDMVESVSLWPSIDEAAQGEIFVHLEEDGTELWQGSVAIDGLVNNEKNLIIVSPALTDVKGKTLTLRIEPTNGVYFWYGTTRQAGKFDVDAAGAGVLTMDGLTIDGELAMVVQGSQLLNAVGWYWPVVSAIGVILCLLAAWVHVSHLKGKSNKAVVLVEMLRRYSYLLRQLIKRDFKVKYKASALGILWSFLNPLLMMIVYYFVFSTLFRSNIEHFPAYLMSGIVLFNYFSEATNFGLNAIVGNSQLITKVYMPKYIYPLSKVLSSAVNMCIAMIPVLVVMLFTGVTFHKSMLLLPLVIVFIITLCAGISLILSTMMVFFRDTQFLWSVLLTMWNFLTPVFYPESIIPAQFLTLYHMNPMYQIIYFMRCISLQGISPTPITYLYCTLSTVVPLLIGLYVFHKKQDRFVLHL